jgi:pyrroline-5-carboxylate reductase
MATIEQLGVLGAGPMGSAIIRGALASELVQPSKVIVVDHDQGARDAMASLGCTVASDASALASHPCVLLAVRPQDFAQAANTMQSDQPRLVVSVMAGLGTSAIAAALGAQTRVVRTMPNTAASIGEAVVGIVAGETATPADTAQACALLSGVGRTLDVRESQMHAVTAVSGSGPAYVYLMAEAIESQALELGLDQRQVNTLLRGMLRGASMLFDGDDRSPATLREAVTTPGGTTEAGLQAMRASGFVEAVRAGVRAACERGEQLSVDQD